MKITTNHHKRPYLSTGEVPEEIVESYDYLHPSMLEGIVWLEYQGQFYHNTDFDMLESNSDAAKAGWEAVIEDGEFTGLVIKDTSLDEYVIGTYRN